MIYSVHHTTTYRYTEPVAVCQNQVRLTPRRTPTQETINFRLHIDPEPLLLRSWFDAFGNEVWYFSIEEPHSELCVTASSRVDVTPCEVPSFVKEMSWESACALLNSMEDAEARKASQYRFESPYIKILDEAKDYVRESFKSGTSLFEAVLDLTSRIYRDFKYTPTATAVDTPTAHVFRTRRGVCQDFAHLQITCLRSLGIAVRYVSGYLMTLPPPGKEKLVGADASHAWLSVYFPRYGWIDFDPTNNVIPRDRHVTIGWGRDYGDVCPIKGVLTGGGSNTLTVAVDVVPEVALPPYRSPV